MIRRPISLALRLTLLFGVASAIVFPVFGWIVIQSTEHHFVTEESDELMVVADAVRALFEENRTVRDLSGLDQRFADILVGHHDASLRLTGPDGKVVYASAGPNLNFLEIDATGSRPPVGEWQDDEHNYRILQRKLPHADTANIYTLTVAVPIDRHLRFLAEFRRNLWLMIAGSIALMSLMGWVAVHQGHAPLHDIVARIRRISVDRLNTRLNPETVPVELTELATSFNEMLERVDSAFQRLSEFNADIAHELRTPIANLMTQAQVGLSRERTAQEYQEILYSSTEEYERMGQMVGDMLYLAKADSDPRPHTITSVDLGEEFDALFEFYGGWANERGVNLSREGEATVTADRLMLQRAFSNLISNAIKNTTEGGTVVVKLFAPNQLTVTITMENPGEDIPPAHWPRLFDRFYRLDKSRRNGDHGVGLGLAIVKSVVDAHQGDIAVHSGNGKTSFTVSLPMLPLSRSLKGAS